LANKLGTLQNPTLSLDVFWDSIEIFSVFLAHISVYFILYETLMRT